MGALLKRLKRKYKEKHQYDDWNKGIETPVPVEEKPESFDTIGLVDIVEKDPEPGTEIKDADIEEVIMEANEPKEPINS